MTVTSNRIAAALALWRMVAIVRRHRTVPPSVRDGLRWLAFDVSAGLLGRGQVKGQPCDWETALAALDALLDDLVVLGIPWSDVVSRVNQHRERRPG